jgi:hypothetical protein
MKAYGPIGCAVDAGFDDPGTGVISGGGNNIDHDVMLVGWDDSKGRNGAWIMRNSWGTGWGDRGYAWIEYGSFSIGTEAVWASATPVPVPPAPPIPPPNPPGPPVPPAPPSPVIGGDITFSTDVKAGRYKLTDPNAVVITKSMTIDNIVTAFNTQNGSHVINDKMTLGDLLQLMQQKPTSEPAVSVAPGKTPDCACKACSCSPCKCTANLPAVPDQNAVLRSRIDEQDRKIDRLIGLLEKLSEKK